MKNPFKNRLTILLMIALALCIGIRSARSGEIVKVKLLAKDDKVLAEFWVWNRLLGRLAKTSGEDQFYKKVENWERRLEALFESRPNRNRIKARYYGGHGVVYNGSTRILSFDRASAQAVNSKPLAEARKWAAGVRFLLKTAPFLKLSKKVVTVPLNENVFIHYKARLAKPMEFFNYNPDLINVSDDRKSKKLVIYGGRLGKGSVTIKSGAVEKILYFRVKERAAQIPKYVGMKVSGGPISGDQLKKALDSILRYRSSPRQGAVINIGKPIKKAFGSLKPGMNRHYIIPVKIEGEDYIPAFKKVSLTVDNTGFHRPEPEILLVSNNPEVIKKDGDLLRKTIKVGQTARYFFHHRNDHNQPWRTFYTALVNNASYPVKVFVSPVGAGPTPDEIFAGHLAASDFFKLRNNKAGWFVTIKPKSTYFLEALTAKPDQTISGVGYVSVISGGQLQFACYSKTMSGHHENTPAPPPVTNKKLPRTSRGVFPAFIEMNPVHEIGGKYTFIYLGGEPYQKDLEDGGPNYGNYGAFYKLDISIKNNHPETRQAEIYIIPGGGACRGVLKMDGKMLETPLLSAGQRTLLKTVAVPPGKTENVNILTMPQGGSYYPVKIVVESEYVKTQ